MNLLDKLGKEMNVAVVIKSQCELDYVVEYLTKNYVLCQEDFNFRLELVEGEKLILIRDLTIKSINLENCFNNGYDIVHLSTSMPEAQYPIEYRLEVSAQGSKEEIADALVLISKHIVEEYSQKIVGGQYLDNVATLDVFEPTGL